MVTYDIVNAAVSEARKRQSKGGTAYRNISEAWKTCKVHFDLETSDIGICELEAACARKLSDCDKRRNPVTGFELIKREIPQRATSSPKPRNECDVSDCSTGNSHKRRRQQPATIGSESGGERSAVTTEAPIAPGHRVRQRTASSTHAPITNDFGKGSPRAGLIDADMARELWQWYRAIDMQQVTHIGNEETTHCWSEMRQIREMQFDDFKENQPLLNLVATVRFQYLDGFTGRARRITKRSGSKA